MLVQSFPDPPPPKSVDYNVRVVVLAGTPWFTGTDVVEALGLGRDKCLTPHDVLRTYCVGELRKFRLKDLKVNSYADEFLIRYEDVLKLLQYADSMKAHHFEHWLYDEVLPFWGIGLTQSAGGIQIAA